MAKINVLPNATQSNPSPSAVTTVQSDPWKFIDQELENKLNDKYKNVVLRKPRFIHSF